VFPAQAAGTYQIVASRYGGKGHGPYTLSVREGSNLEAQSKQQAPRPAGAGFDQRRFMLGMVGMYAFPVLLFLMCAITAFVCLIKRNTRDWFRLAGQARREHWEMLRSLRD
jgi:heme/copper-type cytochrome/quinol oxidase subunit 2